MPSQSDDISGLSGQLQDASAVAADQALARASSSGATKEPCVGVDAIVRAVEIDGLAVEQGSDQRGPIPPVATTRTPPWSKGMPAASYSAFMWPAPMPSSNRPSVTVAMPAVSRRRVDRMTKVVVEDQGSDMEAIGRQRRGGRAGERRGRRDEVVGKRAGRRTRPPQRLARSPATRPRGAAAPWSGRTSTDGSDGYRWPCIRR